MELRNRILSALLAGLLVLGGAACATDDTQEETGVPEEGIDAGEGAPAEGGVGEEPVEDEGPTG